MPTVFRHAVIPLATGKIIAERKMPARFWVLGVICSVLADADVVAFNFGIEYGHFFGHRGFFHSLTFALLLSVIVMLLAFRKTRLFSKEWWYMWLFFFGISASHGVLDAFTNGGLGIALLSPFDTGRYFFPWQPISVSPIGIMAVFTFWGWRALASEIIWIWVPLFVLLVIAKFFRSIKAQKNT